MAIELTFGDSAAGALQCACHLPGAAKADLGEVRPLTLALDIGRIGGAHRDIECRRAILYALLADYGGAVADMWAQNRQTVQRLAQAAADREPIRAWISLEAPDELCGLLWLCAHLPATPTPIQVLPVPAWVRKEEVLQRRRGTGELDPAEVPALLGDTLTLSAIERQAAAHRWHELAAQDDPLRALVNGRLMGVPADFYDFCLLRAMPDGPFVEAQVLGRALAGLPGVSDWWLHQRLLDMTAAGALLWVRPATGDHPYSGVLRRA